MGWQLRGGGRMEDRIDVDAGARAARRITDAAGEYLHDRVVAHTPIGEGSRDRLPGTLRRSIEQSATVPVTAPTGLRGFRTSVFTDDPVAPHVEWDTRPHDIPNAFGRGHDFGIGGRFDGKFHPGTTGQHMFAKGAAETVAAMRTIAGPVLAKMRREVWR